MCIKAFYKVKGTVQCKVFRLGLSNNLFGIFFTPYKFPEGFKSEELKSLGNRKQRTLHNACSYATRMINLVRVLENGEK